MRQKLKEKDVKMVYHHQRRKDLAALDLRHSLVAGDRVLMKQKLPGKLVAKCTGPYTFIKFVGPTRSGAELLDIKGALQVCAVANLLPFHAEYPTAAAANQPSTSAPTGNWRVHEVPAAMWDSDSSDTDKYLTGEEDD